MRLRIVETVREMFCDPRIKGTVMLWIIPSLVAFNTDMTFKCAFCLSLGLFLFCFFCVRFTLD